MPLSRQETLDFLSKLCRSQGVAVMVQDPSSGLHVRLYGLLAVTCEPFDFIVLAPHASAEPLRQSEMEFLLRHSAVFSMPLQTLLDMNCEFIDPRELSPELRDQVSSGQPFTFGLSFNTGGSSWSLIVLDVGLG